MVCGLFDRRSQRSRTACCLSFRHCKEENAGTEITIPQKGDPNAAKLQRFNQ